MSPRITNGATVNLVESTQERRVDNNQKGQEQISDNPRDKEVSSMAKLLALPLQQQRHAQAVLTTQNVHLDNLDVGITNSLIECAVSNAKQAGIDTCDQNSLDLGPFPKSKTQLAIEQWPTTSQSPKPSLIIPNTFQPNTDITTSPSL